MVEFKNINYERMDFKKTKEKIEKLTKKLEKSQNYKEFLETFEKINDIHLMIEQNYDYADVCNMRDDSNEFYQNEMDYWNEYKPKFDLLFKDVYQICIATPFRKDIQGIIPDNFFNTIEYQSKISSEDILELQKKDNELKSQYRKIMNRKCIFKDKEYNLSYISSFFNSLDRNERKEAHDTYNNFFIDNQKELDNLFLEMIKNRNEMAHRMNFSNYAEMSIYSLRRFGYSYKEIREFRNNIKKHILPLVKEIKEIKKKELELDTLEYYDTIFYKKTCKILYKGEDLINKVKDIVKSINEEAGNLYSEMLEKGYIDLVNRDHKVNFAITNYLTVEGIPVITGNFRNKYTDLATLLHEFGHSFQKYIAGIEDKKHIVSPLLKYPTFDIAEMFSFSMELIGINYTKELFSDEDHNKFAFLKIKDLVSVMPYIAAIDEFQEQIYSKNNITIDEVRKTWLDLCNDYDMMENNCGHSNLDKGGFFYRQSHIFLNPFYYIDYAISYFGAFAIWQKCTEDLDFFKEMAAVASYYPLNELIDKFDIDNPFDEKSVIELACFLNQQLNRFS